MVFDFLLKLLGSFEAPAVKIGESFIANGTISMFIVLWILYAILITGSSNQSFRKRLHLI